MYSVFSYGIFQSVLVFCIHSLYYLFLFCMQYKYFLLSDCILCSACVTLWVLCLACAIMWVLCSAYGSLCVGCSTCVCFSVRSVFSLLYSVLGVQPMTLWYIGCSACVILLCIFYIYAVFKLQPESALFIASLSTL